MGEGFLPWLVVAARMLGPHIRISPKSSSFFDALDEYRRRSENAATGIADLSTLVELGFILLPHKLELLGVGGSEQTALEWLRCTSSQLSVEQLGQLQDFLTRHHLRWDAKAPIDADRAADGRTRRASAPAIYEAMASDFEEGLEHVAGMQQRCRVQRTSPLLCNHSLPTQLCRPHTQTGRRTMSVGRP